MKEINIKKIQSFSIGAIVAIFFVVTVTILAELYAPLKDFLKNMFYHHWIGKGVLAIAVFLSASFISYFFIRKSNIGRVIACLRLLVITAIIGFAVILFFFLYESMV